MRKIIPFFLVMLWVSITSCSAQHLVQDKSDAPKLVTNKQLFIEKDLASLLQQIKPTIKRVSANPSQSNETQLGYFVFSFVDENTYNTIRKQNKYPLQITVFVKDPFEWERLKWPLEQRFRWTKEDAEKYGHLTVLDIRVFGEVAE